MARSKGLLGMPVLALSFYLALGLAAIGLAGCVTADVYNNQATDYTHKDAVEGNSAALIFSGSIGITNTENADVVIESLDGETLNWRSKPSIGKGMTERFPSAKGVIPAGKHSYVITTTTGRGRLEGEMEFISGHVYLVRILSLSTVDGIKMALEEVPFK